MNIKQIKRLSGGRNPVRILIGLMLLVTASMGGCDRKESKTPARALPLTREAVSAEDGMILLDHPGPKGQVLLADGSTLYYCDIPGLFRAIRDTASHAKISHAFAQPFDDREWSSFKDGWADAENLLYVVGSNQMGAMGPTFVPFQRKESAHAFARAHGGRVLNQGEITADFLEAHSREVREKMRTHGAGAMSGQMNSGKTMPGLSSSHPDKKNNDKKNKVSSGHSMEKQQAHDMKKSMKQ